MSQTYEKRWSETHEDIAQRMTLMQDTFMNVIFRDRKCVQTVLQDIFDDPTLEIVESFPQEKLVNLFGKETQMDLLAVTEKVPCTTLNRRMTCLWLCHNVHATTVPLLTQRFWKVVTLMQDFHLSMSSSSPMEICSEKESRYIFFQEHNIRTVDFSGMVRILCI